MTTPDEAENENHEWYNLESHFEWALESMFEEQCHGAYELQVLKTMAAFGEPLAAQYLRYAYADGEFDEEMKPQPLEELRWTLIQLFLEGDKRWNFHPSEQYDGVSGEDAYRVVNEVRTWIKENPIAHSAAFCASKGLPRQLYYITGDMF